MNSTPFQALGNKNEFKGLETFPLKGLLQVTMESDEVTAVCPITGQPDQYTVTITYTPDGKGLESKSLKLYFQQFRSEGIFCEQFASRILKDVYKALKPKSIEVTVKQKSRGGISIEARKAKYG